MIILAIFGCELIVLGEVILLIIYKTERKGAKQLVTDAFSRNCDTIGQCLLTLLMEDNSFNPQIDLPLKRKEKFTFSKSHCSLFTELNKSENETTLCVLTKRHC